MSLKHRRLPFPTFCSRFSTPRPPLIWSQIAKFGACLPLPSSTQLRAGFSYDQPPVFLSFFPFQGRGSIHHEVPPPLLTMRDYRRFAVSPCPFLSLKAPPLRLLLPKLPFSPKIFIVFCSQYPSPPFFSATLDSVFLL